eukprot:IDg23134t1
MDTEIKSPDTSEEGRVKKKHKRAKRRPVDLYGYYAESFYKNDSPRRKEPAFKPFSAPCLEHEHQLTPCECKASMELLVMAKRNYKVYVNIGRNECELRRQLTVLDTGAARNFVRTSALSEEMRKTIKDGPPIDVRDANKRLIRIEGVISLSVQVGTMMVQEEFLVCDRLAAPYILGCTFLDRFVTAIFPKDKILLMNDGSSEPIVRRPLKMPPPAQKVKPSEPELKLQRTSPVVRVAEPKVLQPGTQAWILCRSNLHGFHALEPKTELLRQNGITVTNGVLEVSPNTPYRIMVANFSKNPYRLSKNQAIAGLRPIPNVPVVPVSLTAGELLGIEDPEDLVSPDHQVAQEQLMAADLRLFQDLRPDSKVNRKKEEIFKVADLDLSHLSEEWQEKLRAMLAKHERMWNGFLGEINTTEHHIELEPGTRPIRQHPYRAGHHARDFVSKEIDKMLREGVIRPSKSEWASPVVLAPKADGSLRLCIDYRRLNAVTKRDSYPLPRMDDCLDSLGNAKVFPSLDANWGYWQTPMAPKAIPYTSFTCHKGLFEFVRMPFGLMNAPATFQRALDIILAGYKWQTCLVYLDDVIVFSRNYDEHLVHLDQVLTALKGAGVTLHLRKCEFFTDRIKYLGHIIRPGTLEVEEAATRCLKNVRQPTTPTELRSFLGLCNVYRRFVRSYTDIAAPLYRLLKWTPLPKELEPFSEIEEAAYRTLIKSVTEPPVLALPKPGLPYSIDTD